MWLWVSFSVSPLAVHATSTSVSLFMETGLMFCCSCFNNKTPEFSSKLGCEIKNFGDILGGKVK